MPPVSRRTLLKGAVAGGLGLSGGSLLSSCGTGGGSGRKRLQFWAFTDTRIAWQKKAFELYKKETGADFEIDWIIFPYQQMHDKLLVTAQGGSGGPDIVDVEISQFARFIKGDVLFVDLKPKLTEMGEWENFYHASATDPWSWQGKTYGIGNELNACLLSYRHDVWEKAGVSTEITSHDQFVEEAKRFHADTGNHLIDQAYTDWSDWWMLALQQKGGFFNAEGKPTLDNEAGIRTLQYMQQSVKEGWSTLRPLGQAYNVALEQGKIASLQGPSWQFSGFVQQNIPKTKGLWHLMPMPAWAEGGGSRTATWGGTGVSVSKLSDYVEEAVDFVAWEHANTEAVMFDFAERQVWPTYRPAFEDPKLTEPLEFFDNQEVGSIIREVSPEINPAYNSPFWPETTDACVRIGLTPAMQNTGMAPQRALTDAQSEAEDIIDFETA